MLNQVILLHSGYLSDEFLHIEAGHHLAPGYLDFPPVIGFLAFLQNLFHTDSIVVNRLFVQVAGVLIIVFYGKTVLVLGGKRLALVLSLLCILFSPALGLSQSLFLPVVFEQLFWVLCLYMLALYCADPGNKYLIYFAILAALGFLTKYSILLLFAGLFLSILMWRRDVLMKKTTWVGLLIFIILIAPNIWWQYDHQFPVFRHISELYDTQLDKTSIWGEIRTLALFLNPVSMVLVLASLFIVPFVQPFKPFRLLSFSLVISFILLVVARGKFYYYLPIMLGLIPMSAVYFESILRGRKWIACAYLSVLMVAGVYLMPHAMPLLKLDTYISFYRLDKDHDQMVPLQFDNYYFNELWDPILESVKDCYANLPEGERNRCLVWGRHYAYACGINLIGGEQDLPKAFSFHSSCYNWVPEFSKDVTIIAVADKGWTKQHYLKYFDEVNELDRINNAYALNENWSLHTIFLCRKLKYNSAELKQIFKNEIY